MKIALIGCGGGGSKVIDKCLAVEQETGRDFIRHATAINSATADFGALDVLTRDDWVLIGQDETKGHGTGADNRLGAKIAKADKDRIQRAIGDIPIYEIDAIFVVAALGGGTGSGAAPVISQHLQANYDEPVYGVAMLPSMNEGGRAQLNTARSLESFVDVAENLIVMDNEVWRRSGETVSSAFDWINREIAKRFVALFGAGEIDGSTAAETVVDSSEIIKTLECGGISSIGYSTAETTGRTQKGILGKFRTNGSDEGEEMTRQETKIHGMIQQAVTGQLTVPCTQSSTRQALAVVSGPEDELSRGGIESARSWVETECQTPDVRAGDDPRGQDQLIGTVLLSGVTDCPRVEEIQADAAGAQERMNSLNETHDEKTDDLVSSDEIDGLL